MKKSLKITIIALAVCLALIASFFAVTYFAFKDRISNSEKKLIGTTNHFTHSTEKDEKLEIPFSPRLTPVGEDKYLVDIVFYGTTDNANYEVKNARVMLNINNNVNILSSFCSADGPNFTVPNIKEGDFQRLECFSDKGYVHIKMLLSGSEAKNSKITVEYYVYGKQLYLFNKFHHVWEDIEFVNIEQI